MALRIYVCFLRGCAFFEAVCMMRRFAQPRWSAQRPLPYSCTVFVRAPCQRGCAKRLDSAIEAMQFPESWLRSFVDPPLSSEALAHALTMAGLEVEALSTVAPPCSDVVVGRVLDVSRHPDADRLRVCTVDIGNGATLSIVCGAPNVAPGIKAPCAKPGAQLPPAGPERDTPVRIRASRLRGVDSQGML